jgi:hypothetical protein
MVLRADTSSPDPRGQRRPGSQALSLFQARGISSDDGSALMAPFLTRGRALREELRNETARISPEGGTALRPDGTLNGQSIQHRIRGAGVRI